MKKNNCKELRKVQLEILKEFIAICEKLNLQYFAIGGTAIGAVRHQGYIPWDDDIDVAMLKEDYDKFISEAPKLLPDYLFLQTIDSEPSYLLNGFAKIRDSRTTFIESSVAHISMNHGIYVDIFVCYYAPPSKLKRYWHYIWQQLYAIRLGTEVNQKSPYLRKPKIITKVLRFLLCLIYTSPSDVRKRLDNLFNSVSSGDSIILADSTWGIHGFPRKWFEETVKVPFEGIEVCLPKEYDKFLRARFGDYMQLPPEEQRVAHHYADVIDPDKPYTDYIGN